MRAARAAHSDKTWVVEMTELDAVCLTATKSELDALPGAIRLEIEGEGLNRLRGIRDKIIEDAQFPMPPICVVPWGLVTPNRDGVVWGYVSFAHCMQAQKVGAFLPAAAHFAIQSDELLRGVIVHEFAHAFWCEVQFLRSIFDGAPEIGQALAGTPAEQFSRQSVEDKNQLVDARDWFGDWDVQHFLSGYDEPQLQDANHLFHEQWAKAGLPVKVHDLTPHSSGVGEISDEVVDRARALGLVKNAPPST